MRGIHRIPCGNVNCYLVQGEESAVLVDTGYTGYVERLLDTCLGAGVRLIVLTHGHLDHIQNTALLMERLGVPAALHPADLGLLTDQQSQPLSAQGPAGRLLLSLSRHSFQTQAFLPFTPTVELREGDSLAPWGVDARVLELPGHTAGSIGLDVEGHSLIAVSYTHLDVYKRQGHRRHEPPSGGHPAEWERERGPPIRGREWDRPSG